MGCARMSDKVLPFKGRDGNSKQPEGVRFDGPCNPMPSSRWPCSQCSHEFGEHAYLYTIGTRDYYRCAKKLRGGGMCQCGKQYEPIVATLPDGATEADVQRLMREMTTAHEAVTATKPVRGSA
jgi:hypothetical protein